MPQHQTLFRPTTAGRVTLRYIGTLIAVYTVAGILAAVMTRWIPFHSEPGEIVFPGVFWGTTVLLALGSYWLQRAQSYVKREKQRPFRRCLLLALVAGTLFVGIQSYGLSCMIGNQAAEAAQTGANAFLTMLSAVHAMHFVLAQMFLVWVTLSALADRYDHEYWWGVTVCTWFWHGLGIIWLLILVIFLIAKNFNPEMGRLESPESTWVAVAVREIPTPDDSAQPVRHASVGYTACRQPSRWRTATSGDLRTRHQPVL
ncbi:MAG: cytochrome c oxidase subunit 3 [Planctomycetes bacterium]|nr:cytochrome c oxidase subunit 3 [Planctomycetota bacterium]